ncbi:response regulator transcription factor [Clostridium transplantifaecale]|uniref:response regulator transcription factor n=1 Tax=Clostridium transplantifaecale TaxID=2479838 RepID=UPI000F62DA02|nr:response regulator transcription factor [Clostridium transplantifaecale]
MEHIYRLLAVDDEPDILRTNQKYLESRGYRVDTAACAKDGLELLRRYSYDCILLDVLLPDLNGFELCKAVRAITSAPILFLSCMDDEEDKIRGLMSGGDDYITKPYSLKELAARVYAQVRRSVMKGFTIDHQQQSLTVGNRVILLSQKEFDVFLYLLGNPGRILSPEELYREVWRTGLPDTTNSIAVHIARLRKKLGDAGHLVGTIETIRGEGYLFHSRSEARTKI